MIHRIELSTTLLIAVKTEGTGTTAFQPKVAGVKVTARPATILEKGTHAVNQLGNIISTNRKKEVTA